MKGYTLKLLILAFSGCIYSLYAYSEEPQTLIDRLPEHWEYTEGFSQEFPSDDKWWEIFNDALLDSLIREGENNNYNLREAGRRIEMARATITQAKSGYYPSFSIDASYTRARTSGLTTSASASAMNTGYFSGMLNMNWEVGIFGKIQNQVKEEEANYSASRADYASVCVSLCAEIAADYMSLRTLQEELRVTEEHLKTQKEVLDITQTRFEVGLVSMLDVAQAKTVYYSTKASLSTLRTQIATTINAIAILTGNFPQDMFARLSQYQPQPKTEYAVKVGIPMNIIRRRPDVMEAEYQLAAYAAALGVAKKDFLPTVSLNGSLGTSAYHAKDLFSKNSFEYSIAPTISWTFFDGFSRKASEASAREQFLAGIDSYNQTILTAVQEVDNAMITYTESLKYENELEEVIKNAQLSFNLALDRYKQGLDAFINVADSQLTLLEYANELVTARGNTLAALISLYKALGGGWDIYYSDKNP